MVVKVDVLPFIVQVDYEARKTRLTYNCYKDAEYLRQVQVLPYIPNIDISLAPRWRGTCHEPSTLAVHTRSAGETNKPISSSYRNPSHSSPSSATGQISTNPRRHSGQRALSAAICGCP